jgi:hypothetical protein
LSTHVTHAGVAAAPSHTPPVHAVPSGSASLTQPPATQLSAVHALLSPQSLAPKHSTHSCAVVSHSGVPGVPAQSPSSAQPGAHVPVGLQNSPTPQLASLKHSTHAAAAPEVSHSGLAALQP